MAQQVQVVKEPNKPSNYPPTMKPEQQELPPQPPVTDIKKWLKAFDNLDIEYESTDAGGFTFYKLENPYDPKKFVTLRYRKVDGITEIGVFK